MAETLSSICQSLPPLVAFGRDFPVPQAESEDPSLQHWLVAAVCLWRIAQMEDAERPSGFSSASRMLRTLDGASTEDASPAIPVGAVAPDRQMSTLADLLSAAAAKFTTPGQWSPSLARTVRAGAEYLEQRGAFRLAYSLLAGFREAVIALGMTDVGRTVALQGRLARQLGAMQTADDHYRVAERIGRNVREPNLYIRALIGRGVLAATRGNYPEARVLFRRGLRAARKSGVIEHEAAAHNALLMAAVAAKDLDSALIHGWGAFTCSAQRPDGRAEILINLAEVALLAGHPESALSACAEALALTTVDRVLLAGYGTGAIAAARLGRRDVVDTMASESVDLVHRSRQELDKAYTLLELGEAYVALGAPGEARGFLARALGIAEPAGFFEILHRAHIAAEALAGIEDEARANERETLTLSVPLAALTASGEEHDDSDSALSWASRRVLQSLAELRS